MKNTNHTDKTYQCSACLEYKVPSKMAVVAVVRRGFNLCKCCDKRRQTTPHNRSFFI